MMAVCTHNVCVKVHASDDFVFEITNLKVYFRQTGVVNSTLRTLSVTLIVTKGVDWQSR